MTGSEVFFWVPVPTTEGVSGIHVRVKLVVQNDFGDSLDGGEDTVPYLGLRGEVLVPWDLYGVSRTE